MTKSLFLKTGFPPLRFLSLPTRVVLTGWFIVGCADLIALAIGVDINAAFTKDFAAEFTLGLLLMFGSGIVLCSCVPWRREDWSWAFELIGWPVLVSAWLLYALYSGYGTVWPASIILGISFAGASLWRFFEVIYMAKRTRRILQDISEERGGFDA